MSAFIVDPKVINRLLSHLNARHRQHDGADYAFRDLKFDVSNIDSLRELGSQLFLMNCDAVDARYGKGTAAHDTADTPEYTFKFEPATPVSALKSGQCLRYQCSEGDVPERPLYKALDSCLQTIAEHIVGDMPEYESATWGE